MPKIKTNKSAAKRIKVTKGKKFKFQKTGRRHRLENSSPKLTMQGRRSAYVNKVDEGRIKQLLPYA